MILGGFFLFWMIFSRTPHKLYAEHNGTLVPIEMNSPFNYPDPASQAQVYNPYGGQQPYGQPNNPYAGQPHPVHIPAGSPYGNTTPVYGSQYPQAQYLNQYNQYQQSQPVPGSYPQQHYNPPQPKSQFTVDRPQPHQPYPNSVYA